MVPTFTAYRSTGEAPSYAPATSPRLRRRHSPWPPRPATLTNRGVPNTAVLVRIADQPRSTGFELAGDLRSVKALVPLVRLPVLLAGPGPSGSPDPSRRCRGCLPPSPSSLGSGCPQLRHAAATARRWRSLTSTRYCSASWRTKSPSQWPGTARSWASAGRWLRTTSAVTCPCGLLRDRSRGARSARPVRRHATSSLLSAPRPSMNRDW